MKPTITIKKNGPARPTITIRSNNKPTIVIKKDKIKPPRKKGDKFA